MKKAMRKLLCVALVMLLVATMTTPAMAVPASGTGEWEGYSYRWSVECGNTHGIAQISTSGKPGYVKAYAENTLYYEAEAAYGMSYSADSLDAVVTYYVTASVTADNTFTYQGREVTGTIKKTFGKFWVQGENVIVGAYANP